MPRGSMQGCIQVVEQSRCRTHRQQTTTIAQMQSQQSIHSPSPRERGLGFRQGCRYRTPKGFARTQSQKSVLKGIENLLHFYKNRLFLQLDSLSPKAVFFMYHCSYQKRRKINHRLNHKNRLYYYNI